MKSFNTYNIIFKHIIQAMWALGNIAGDGANMRNYVLEKGIIKPLIAYVSGNTKKLQVRILSIN